MPDFIPSTIYAFLAPQAECPKCGLQRLRGYGSHKLKRIQVDGRWKVRQVQCRDCGWKGHKHTRWLEPGEIRLSE